MDDNIVELDVDKLNNSIDDINHDLSSLKNDMERCSVDQSVLLVKMNDMASQVSQMMSLIENSACKCKNEQTPDNSCECCIDCGTEHKPEEKEQEKEQEQEEHYDCCENYTMCGACGHEKPDGLNNCHVEPTWKPKLRSAQKPVSKIVCDGNVCYIDDYSEEMKKCPVKEMQCPMRGPDGLMKCPMRGPDGRMKCPMRDSSAKILEHSDGLMKCPMRDSSQSSSLSWPMLHDNIYDDDVHIEPSGPSCCFREYTTVDLLMIFIISYLIFSLLISIIRRIA
jgi:hypothetical protein